LCLNGCALQHIQYLQLHIFKNFYSFFFVFLDFWFQNHHYC